MDYLEWIPERARESAVVCCWRLRSDAAAAKAADAEPALPDGCPELLFNFADPFEYQGPDGQTRVQPRAFLVGQLTRPFVVRPTGRVDLFAVRFEAHGASALHPDLSTVRDTWVDAIALSTGSVTELHRRLAPLGDVERRVALAEWIASLPQDRAKWADAVAGVVREIRESRGAVALDALAARHGISLRTLQRQFVTRVGVSPKLLARIIRFHDVCLAWRHAPETMSRVAADCGYCDESHLIRDFRTFVGEPPGTFLAQLPRFTALFLSAAPTRQLSGDSAPTTAGPASNNRRRTRNPFITAPAARVYSIVCRSCTAFRSMFALLSSHPLRASASSDVRAATAPHDALGARVRSALVQRGSGSRRCGAVRSSPCAPAGR